METVLQDFRHATRALFKSPGFTTTAVLTLALGIGANTAIFSVIEAVMLRALPYRDSSRLVLIADAEHGDDGGFLYKDLAAFKEQSRSFEDLAVYFRNSGYSRATLNAGNEPQQMQGAWVTANLFRMMGVGPEIGRVFTQEEEARQDRVVVLSHRLWTQRFAGLRDVLDKTISINGLPFRIIGVMPAVFQFPAPDQMFWAPLTTNPSWGDPAVTTQFDPRHSPGFYQRWQMIARLRGDTSFRQAQLDTDINLHRLAEYAPDPFRVHDLRLVPLQVTISGNTRLALTVLFVAVGFVLLIACTNVANLVLARGTGRAHEIAIRTALGASRSRLIWQLVAESLFLAIAAAVVGAALAFAGIPLLLRFGPPNIPRLEQAGLDITVLVFTFGLSLLTTVLVGLGPALHISRRDPKEALVSMTQSATASRGLRRARNLLVVGEFAISAVLLSGAGLLLRSLLAVEAVDPGFEPRHVLTLRMAVPDASPTRLAGLHEQVLRRLSKLPGVAYVGAISDLFEPGRPGLLGLRAIEGRSVEPEQQWTALTWNTVSGDYFQAIGASLLKGRYFNDQDTAQSPLVVIVDESMSRRYWPGQDPVGAHIKGQDPRGHDDQWLTIIGVVRDMHRSGLENTTTPHVYEWYRQAGVSGTDNLVVRAAGDPRALATSLRVTVRAEASTAILSSVNTVEDLLSEQLAPRRFQAWLLGLFSSFALLLAGIGIYSVMHYAVAQRTHEIGVRIALGARPVHVIGLVETEGLRLAMAGMSLGLIGALIFSHLMSSLLFGVHPTDPLTLTAVVSVLMVAALVACYIPARRAMRVDPMIALRYE
jgi:putative ABC transport system permease protein